MTWTDNLLRTAHSLGYDLTLTLDTLPNGMKTLGFVSNLTWDNHVRHLPNSPDGKDWWLAAGPKPIDVNKLSHVWTPLVAFTTQLDADNASHKGKRIVSINMCAKSAKTMGDPYHPYVYAVPDKK